MQLETTICNEIRQHHEPVVIDDVSSDARYAEHHTPKFYGLQSYISYPIVLKDGSFFGTLCAIDTRPAQVSNIKVTGTFALFSQLLAFHLDSLEVMEKSQRALADTSRELMYYKDESRQIQHISGHTLQEPLRKIRVFSDFLVNHTAMDNLENAKDVALKINNFALDISGMIRELAAYSNLSHTDDTKEQVDLNKTLSFVRLQMDHLLTEKRVVLDCAQLPTVEAIPIQMAQVFSHLIGNAVKFAKTGQSPFVRIYAAEVTDKEGKYIKIVFEDTGIGIEPAALDKIYDIFVKTAPRRKGDGFGSGLAFCRRILHHHGGFITAQSKVGEGSTFSIYLPVAF